MRVPFEDLPIEKDQRDLLEVMVEADRAISPGERQEFFLVRTTAGASLFHPGLNREAVYPGDLRTLAEWSLLRMDYTPRGDEKFDVTPMGRRYYEWMKEQEGEPVERLETEVRRLLDADDFRKRHLAAYERWAGAEAKLWGAETPAQLTDIGHACREAVQQFVTDLVEKHRPDGVDPDPQKTVSRLRAVARQVGAPDSVADFTVALLAYFGAVSDLAQRQEHGAQKEGTPLRWEDARRVVFQTAIVMFELDRVFG